jgi:hypothetical protein
MGFLQTNQLTSIGNDIRSKYRNDANGRTVGWSVFYPPVLDVIRIAARTMVIKSAYKLSPFPTFEELYEKLLTIQSEGSLKTVPLDEAEFKVSICNSIFV